MNLHNSLRPQPTVPFAAASRPAWGWARHSLAWISHYGLAWISHYVLAWTKTAVLLAAFSN